MKLTKTDRVMLINQYEILKRLDEGKADHYQNLVEILSNGFEIFYTRIDESVADNMPESKGQLVLDILTVYRLIAAYKSKHPEDAEVRNHHRGSFRGFDQNNESEYVRFVNFLINKQHVFSEQLKNRTLSREFNSHSPVLETYRQMVARWKQMGKKAIESREDILRILGN